MRSSLLDLVLRGQLPTAARVLALSGAFYRLCFVVAASRAGLLSLLSAGPRPFADIAAKLARDPSTHEALRAWLRLGVRAGELSDDGERYGLSGGLSKALASPAADGWSALAEEIVGLHRTLIIDGPGRFARGDLFTMADQEGALIARSSRVLEPVIGAEVDAFVPRSGALTLLEVGCGSGVYVRRALEQNPRLSVVALELQPEVAEQARANLASWGCASRASVEAIDLRAREADGRFDLMTLHNNIYYFTVDERPAVLRHARAMLRPGGKLLLTTACTGGSLGVAVLDLWAASTRGCGRLPSPREMTALLEAAGFRGVEARQMLPGESFYAFTAVA